MIIFLVSVWVLLVMPVVTPQMPDPKEQQLMGVFWDNQKDCENWTKAPGNLAVMAEMAYQPRAHRHLGQVIHAAQKHAPTGTPVTYTCAEKDESAIPPRTVP